MSIMITVRNLSFSYPRGSRVFEGLSLALPAGEIIGLLGQNGVGKSTLIKLLAALITPQQGEVTFDGKNVARSAELYSRLMVVPEEFTLPKVSVESFVAHTAPLYPAFSREQFDAYSMRYQFGLNLRENRAQIE